MNTLDIPASTASTTSSPSSPPPTSDDRRPAERPSRAARGWGLGLSLFVTAFLLFDSILKLLDLPEAREGTAALGFPVELVRPLAFLEFALLALYWWPRTAVLGAVLWVGYLGGAIAIHLRIGNPWATHTLFPTYVAVLLWGGLALRDPRVRGLALDLLGLRR